MDPKVWRLFASIPCTPANDYPSRVDCFERRDPTQAGYSVVVLTTWTLPDDAPDDTPVEQVDWPILYPHSGQVGFDFPQPSAVYQAVQSKLQQLRKERTP